MPTSMPRAAKTAKTITMISKGCDCAVGPNRLPPELRDLVLDMLSEDIPSLRACSLTHRTWLPRARHHLFRRVYLNRGARGDAFRNLIDNSPHIGRHIREIEISGIAWVEQSPVEVSALRWPTLQLQQDGHDRSRTEPPPISWLRRTLPESPDILSHVISLWLTNLPISRELAEILEKYFSTVTTVVVDACRALTFKEFCELPQALKRVQCLHLLDAHWLRSTGPEPGTCMQKHPTLKTLVLSGKSDSTTVVNWIVRENRYMTLSSLSCDIVGSASAVAMRTLLVALGPSLKYLAVGFSAVRDPTDILNNTGLSLEPCTGLLRLDIHCTHDAHQPSLSWILKLLSKLAAPFLEEVTFSIPAANIGALNLEVLTVVLSHARYMPLKRLIFHVEVRRQSQTCEGIEQGLRKKLQDLVARGIELYVVYRSPGAPRCFRNTERFS